MNIEKKLEKSEFYLKQIIHYNPDPYYVNHFLVEFIQSIIDVYTGILEEANRDFGLFIVEKCDLEKFENKSREKNDKLALDFFSWYNEIYNKEHKALYTNHIKNLISFYEKTGHLSKIKIKIISSQKYKRDISQEITVALSNGKIRSKEELQLEIRRQMPIFLELINHIRRKNGEPKVLASQVMASVFIETKEGIDFEIIDLCQAYLPVLRRLIDSSRNKIKQLTQLEYDNF